MKWPYFLQTPTRREKKIAARSLRGYFADARSGQPYRVSEGWLGQRTTSERMSKGRMKAIYFNTLKKIQKRTRKWKM